MRGGVFKVSHGAVCGVSGPLHLDHVDLASLIGHSVMSIGGSLLLGTRSENQVISMERVQWL